jgi:hypothetical protein
MKKLAVLLMAVLMFALYAYAAAAEEGSMDLAEDQSPAEVVERIKTMIDQTKLQQGKLQSYIIKVKTAEGGEKGRVIGVLLINVPPDKVWATSDDLESRPDWIPCHNYTKIVHTFDPPEEGMDRHFLLNEAIKIAFVKPTYSLDIKRHKDLLTEEWRMTTEQERATWKNKGVILNPPSFGIKNIGGFRYFEPYDNGTKTIHFYSPTMETTVPVPQAILNIGMKLSLPGYMNGMKKEAEKRYGGKK